MAGVGQQVSPGDGFQGLFYKVAKRHKVAIRTKRTSREFSADKYFLGEIGHV